MTGRRSSGSSPEYQSPRSAERKVLLARNVRKRPRRVFLTTLALGIALSVAIAIPVQMVRWSELAALRTDYEKTWCSTYGSEDWDVSYLVDWHEFVERNEKVLEKNLSIDPLFGSGTTVFEVRLNGELARWVKQGNRDYTRIGQQTTIVLIFNELNSVARAESFFPKEDVSFPECS